MEMFMKTIVGSQRITELLEEGLELGHEFELSHTEGSRLLWDNVKSEYIKEDVLEVQNIYFNGYSYNIVLVKTDGSKKVLMLDLSLITSIKDKLEEEINLVY